MQELTLDRVSFAYPSAAGAQARCALSDVSLTIRPGEFVCLVGPSGCGKSTLVRLLAGLSQPTGGAILHGGRPLIDAPVRTALVFQHAGLFPWMRVAKNVAFAARKTCGLSRAEAAARAQELLRAVGLEDGADKYPCELSGGMRQRAALAAALATEAELLLLDEPFSALDHKSRTALRGLLSELWESAAPRPTVVFVTHDIDEALLLGDRVIFLYPGRVGPSFPVPFTRPRREEDVLVSPACCGLRKTLISLFYRSEQEGTP